MADIIRVATFACELCGFIHPAFEGLYEVKKLQCSEIGETHACVSRTVKEDVDKKTLIFALTVTELAFRYAEKGNNLEATLAYVRKVLESK